MALEGNAALAMWWDMAVDVCAEFQHWHTHEHWPERLRLPGFRRATRWQDEDGEGFFVLYELSHGSSLTSPDYLACLNAPTPWSARMMPHHRNMVRSPAQVVASAGGVVAAHLMTVRLSSQSGRDEELSAHLRRLADEWPGAPGAVGLHVLHTATQALVATTETRIRGDADRAADWIVLAAGYEPDALRAAAAGALSEQALVSTGARSGPLVRHHRLRASMRVDDLA